MRAPLESKRANMERNWDFDFYIHSSNEHIVVGHVGSIGFKKTVLVSAVWRSIYSEV